MAAKKKTHHAKCKTITFKHRDGKTLPRSQWATVKRCEGRKWHAGKRCRAGGSNWKTQVRANFRAGKKGVRALAPARFVAC